MTSASRPISGLQDAPVAAPRVAGSHYRLLSGSPNAGSAKDRAGEESSQASSADGDSKSNADGAGDNLEATLDVVEPSVAADPEKMSGEDLLEHAVKIILPDDGYDVSSVATWYKKEGEAIKSAESLVEIETPEFSYDFQSSVTGVLAKILKHEGAEVKSGSVLAYIGKSNEEAEEILAYTQSDEYAEIRRLKKKRAEDAEKEDLPQSEETQAAKKEAAVDDVRSFLHGLEGDMSVYADKLIDEGFDTLGALGTLTMEDLKELEIKKGHARLILQGVEDLKKK